MWLMNNGPDGFLQWLVNITALSPQPLVHSLSYGEVGLFSLAVAVVGGGVARVARVARTNCAACQLPSC